MSAAEGNSTYHILDIQPGTAILLTHSCSGKAFADVISRSYLTSAFAHTLTDDQGDIWIDTDALPEIFAGDIDKNQ